MEHQTFDYIVVGAGAAGCALAARLGENPSRRVLLLEAGDDNRHPWLKLPLGIGKLLNDERFVWPLHTEPEPHLHNRQLYWAQGRGLGGSSSVNGMLFVRGEPAKFDAWRDSGCPGWGYQDLLPIFKRIESCRFTKSSQRGQSGPIPVMRMIADDPISSGFLEAGSQIGLPPNNDYNVGDSFGVARQQFNIRRGLRVSAADAYLKSLRKRNNVTIWTGAQAERISFDGNRAVGVSLRRGCERVEATACDEIILCAGALHSPHILELSGIGDGPRLQRLGLPIFKHLPAVGEHLRDHLQTRITFETNQAVTVNDLLRSQWRLVQELARFTLFRRGLLATPSFKVHAFAKSDYADVYPDLRLQCGLVSGPGRYAHEGVDEYSGFHIGSYPIYPRSRGSVHSASPDPADAPQMQANYLEDERDCAISVCGLRITRELASRAGLGKFILREVRPGPSVSNAPGLLEFVRSSGQTAWHYVGSCRMGIDERSVVGPDLKVHGIDNLRIADASVMPFHVSSNIHVPCIAIGEKAADLILRMQTS